MFGFEGTKPLKRVVYLLFFCYNDFSCTIKEMIGYDMDNNLILEKIADADMVLVGIGEDFDTIPALKEYEGYETGNHLLRENGLEHLIPLWKEYCIGRLKDSTLNGAVNKLAELLQDKNYFVISLSSNSGVAWFPWKHDRIVVPTGSNSKKQCIGGHTCLLDLSEKDKMVIEDIFDALFNDEFTADLSDGVGTSLGVCPECEAPMVMNNILTENYVEEGYLPKWELYKKWLSGTVNRKLVLLELGAGLKYPSVIRWPFEKIAFFNQKATFVRVHDRLSQLTPEIAGKGIGISQNPIDWLLDL